MTTQINNFKKEDKVLPKSIYATLIMISELHHVPFMNEKEYLELLDNAVVEDYTKGANKLQSCDIKLSARFINDFSTCYKDELTDLRHNGLVESMYCFAIKGAISEREKEELLSYLKVIGLQVYTEELQDKPDLEGGEEYILNNHKEIMANLESHIEYRKSKDLKMVHKPL